MKYLSECSLPLIYGVFISLSNIDEMLESAMCSILGIMNTLSIISTNRTV